MTPTLNKREKELNDIIKLDPKLKAPTKAQYKALAKSGDSVEQFTVMPAITFMGKTNESYRSYNSTYIENNGSVISTDDIDNKALIMESTKAFFGISFHGEDQFLYRISDERYFREETEVYTEAYKDWLLLCTNIDAITSYIKLSCPEFDKKQKKYKKQFKDIAEELPHIEFFHLLATFFDYYSLNQIKKAKVDTFVDIGLPNIGKNEAKKIIEMLENKKKFHPDK